MKNSQLDRLLRFAQRTGDRLIITDAEGKEPVVILPLDEYEALIESRSSKPESVRGRDGSPTRPYENSEEEEESVDLAEIEAAVEAVNREATPEPKIVPITRKTQPSEPGEEQFYMEPI
jgi:hypothetical protein